MQTNRGIIISLIAGLSLVITAAILASGIKNRNTKEDTISVVGLGTVDFTSDEILWIGSFSAKATDPKDAYNKVLQDKEKVKQFFLNKGFKEDEFKFTSIDLIKNYRTITISSENSYQTKTETIFDGYTATQIVKFNAVNNPELMTKIEIVSNETSELINSGIEFNSQPLQYTYSQLPSLKHQLIEDATRDARERAEKIISEGKGKKGKLKNASMGVFQITGKGSVEEDSYGGNFDIYTKEKTARITVRLTYNLD